jgi:predicted Co/Zn/Cd cation transporter (cation efflux family)
MEQNILFPLIAAVVFLLSVPLFRFMPMRGNMERFRHGMVIEYLAIGLYCLVITLISYYYNLGTDVVTYLVVGGAVGIGIRF